MTIDEALDRARRTEACWIVWSLETGEILSVTGTPATAGPLVLLQHLEGLGRAVKTRHFHSSSVTRELLEQEQRETSRVRTRGEVLAGWSRAAVGEVVQLLERGHYPAPMGKDSDSLFLVDHLWEVHREELTPPLQARLRGLVGSPALGASASFNLEAYLLALTADEAALLFRWRNGRSCADRSVLLDCLAYLRTREPDFIDDLIAAVETPGMFGPRREAMMALGRLGPAAGNRAAQAIRGAIRDSSAQVSAQRSRVLERIECVSAEWIRCGSCCHGRVHRDSFGTEVCADCLGLGLLRAA